MDGIDVRHNEHGYLITVCDYYGPNTHLEFGLSDDQATELRAKLSPKLMRYPSAVTPAKVRMA